MRVSQILPAGTLFVCLAVTNAASIPGVTTTEKFDNSVILDKDQKFILFWKFNDSHITFEVRVKTTGWVGFGLSNTGSMYPADVVVGWVNSNGKVHFADRHTTAHAMPKMDSSQDWHLLHGEESDFETVLKFVRKINTCDDTEDIVIPEGTARVIYAYNTNDPADDSSIMYHGTTRGTKSVSLRSSYKIPDNMPKTVHEYDFLNTNFIIPNATTTYHCRGFYMPNLGKHHMIKYEPIITPGNEANVHHILLYRCSGIDPAVSDGVNGDCYDNRPKQLPHCNDMILAWAIGGQPFYFPENAGFSISGPGDAQFYIMETHYDNPTRKTGYIDNSGIRITMTTELRPMEAGLFEFGHQVNSHQIIPPGIENFVSTGYCSENCIKEGFRQSHMQEVKLFAAFQHSHLLGVAMKTRHFRNGTELRPIVNDPDYDFDFQENRLLPTEVSVYPGYMVIVGHTSAQQLVISFALRGDSFSVECTYDSRGRVGPTYGGLSTLDEMCLTFVYYYPAMKMVNCLSQPTYDSFHLSPKQLNHAIATSDWSDKNFVADVQQKLKESTVSHFCHGSKLGHVSPENFVEKYSFTPYVPPSDGCVKH